MLSKSDFEKAAEQIAIKFVSPDCEQTLNQLSQKVAMDNNLNPDQIRTMVRLANVSVFGKLFQTKTGGDRNIKFETADPEVVIDAIYDDAKSLKVGTEKTAYDRTSDYYRDLYVVEQVKKAEAAPEPGPKRPKYSKPELAMQLKRANDRFRMEGKQASQRWKMSMETAVSMYKKAHGLETAEAFPGFEMEVLAANANVAPEVQALRAMVLGDKIAAYTDERISHIQDRHVANLQGDTKEIFDFLKVAAASRLAFEECQTCQQKIQKGLRRL
jgi:hypothetical protein